MTLLQTRTRDEEIEEALERWEADKAWEARTRQEIEEAKIVIENYKKENEELKRRIKELEANKIMSRRDSLRQAFGLTFTPGR